MYVTEKQGEENGFVATLWQVRMGYQIRMCIQNALKEVIMGPTGL